MSDHAGNLDRLLDLVGVVCDDSASPNDLVELDSIVQISREARDWYLDYCQLHSTLILELPAQRGVQKVLQQISIRRSGGTSSEFDTAVDAPTRPSSVPTFPVTLWHGTVGYFSSGWPVAYLVATVIFGIGLLVGAFTDVSHPMQIAQQVSPVTKDQLPPEPQTQFVGRITGMVDCQWADPQNAPLGYTVVALGGKYALTSGLMEITYHTGGKVVLQGPATYEVDSAAGGYLSVGKLTARVEKKAERGKRKAEESNPVIPNPLFVIHTPTATVTDLGTEFGVEVDKRGRTTSHVFRGLVRVQAVAAGGKAEGAGQLLRENESVRVDGDRGEWKIVVVPSARSAEFIREIPKRTIKTLDLVDVVAGGDGFSGRRGRGIDPTNGRIVRALPRTEKENVLMSGDGKYHRVDGIPFVDGVFIPDGKKKEVQVDSTGHVFDGFQGTMNATWQYIWASGLMPGADQPYPTFVWGVDYTSPGHGMILLHASNAITFDLEAIRHANPGFKLLRFRALACNIGKMARSADFWVLVDGRQRFGQREITSGHGAFPVLVPIRGEDRFLTLASTDGGDGISMDWIIFGDPRLEFLPVETNRRKDAGN